MLKLFQKRKYEAISEEEIDDGRDKVSRQYSTLWIGAIILFCALTAIALVLLVLEHFRTNPCTNPYLRREWRQLNANEQLNYINAIKCLHSLPSKIAENQAASIYDDFSWVHSERSRYVNKASTFLPFHRYFLSIFEETLRDTCGYTDYLPYWDWTKDWQDPASSPIWDKDLGFGGNGNPAHEDCVEDGQFASFEVSYKGGSYAPHCLARSFNSDNGTGHFSGYGLRPEAVAYTLEQRKYGDFLIELELGPHGGIPDGINGDFHYVTAPNDPVFYLHHVQLDKIWWQWQELDSSRFSLYRGLRNDEPLPLQDKLQALGLGEDKVVGDVLRTESSNLCYRY